MAWKRMAKRICLVFVMTGIILIMVYYQATQWPFSLVYQSTHSESMMVNVSRRLNANRVKKSIDYLDTLTHSDTRVSNLTSLIPQLVVVIITVARRYDSTVGSDNPSYLTQTLAAMDLILKKDIYFDRKFMFMCNVDKHPDKHTEALKLQNHFPYVNKNGGTNMGINVNAVKNVVNNFDPVRRQESEDYVFCLNVSHSLNSSYVLVLEDDVFPTENLLKVISHTLKYRLVREQNGVLSNRKFSYIKLYYPVKWQGFANESDRILELIAIGILGGCFILTSIIISLTMFIKRDRNPPIYQLYMYYIYGVVITIVLALLIGRVNIINHRKVHPQLFKLSPSPGCCTQAMLYHREALPGLMNYLIYNNSHAKDLGIYNYTQVGGDPGYQLEPNLFMHTGMISTLSDQPKKAEEFVYDISNILH